MVSSDHRRIERKFSLLAWKKPRKKSNHLRTVFNLSIHLSFPSTFVMFDICRWSPEQKAARHPYVSFPFGVGPRNCVGMRLALLEAKMAVVAMLQKFRFIRAPDTEVRKGV